MATAQAERAAPGLLDAVNRQVPAESVAVFRIAFGVLVTIASVRFLARGWVDALYLEPANHLTYPGFSWVQPLPAPFMHLVLVGLAAAGAAIALGWHTRLAAGAFAVGFAYIELIDAALYLNHYWFITLAAFLLAVLPVNRFWSLDSRSGRVEASPTVPVGVVWALRAQLAIVYLCAGIAKLNPDWILSAEPMATWLADRTHVPLVGPLLVKPGVAHALSWAGAVFDCTIVFWLSWRRTRRWAYAAVVAFHTATAMLFQIGMFPWVMILATPVFFEPDWPTRLVGRRVRPRVRSTTGSAAPSLHRATVVGLLLLAVLEVVFPLRHLVIPGDVRWNEGGYYGSWRVMLTEKGGSARFRVTDPASGETWEVDPQLVLTDWQAAQAAVRPDLLLATAHLVAEHYEQRVEVRADAWMSMNGSEAVRVVDPELDLTTVTRTSGPWWVEDPPDTH